MRNTNLNYTRKFNFNNIVKIFREIADIVNREFLTPENIKTIENYNNFDDNILKYISSITFGSNCIIIKKMSKDEIEIFLKRNY